MSNMQPPLDIANITSVVTQTVDELTPHDLFHFHAPRETLVGEGAILKIGEMLQRLAVRHVLLVVDKTVYQQGLLLGAERSLARANIKTTVFSGIDCEPGSAIVDQGVAQLARSEADFVLGIGGGSALDAAKAIAMLGSCHCSLDELADLGFSGRRSIGLGAVPTTAGTGSEVTDISVIL